jgi:thiol:disulfide interchange protein DsbA
MPAAKRKSSERVATTQKIFLGLLGAVGVALIGLGIYFSSGGGHSEIPLAGTDYELIENADRPRQKGPIEVAEFFSYACIHCKNFDPAFASWAENAATDVSVSRRPATFSASWSMLGQAYLALEHANALEENHERMFNAIHNAGKRFSNGRGIADYLDSSNLSANDFMRAFNSNSVSRKLSQATEDTMRYQIAAVPTLVVAGKYRVSMKNGAQRALQVTDWLIEQERTRMAAAE